MVQDRTRRYGTWDEPQLSAVRWVQPGPAASTDGQAALQGSVLGWARRHA